MGRPTGTNINLTSRVVVQPNDPGPEPDVDDFSALDQVAVTDEYRKGDEDKPMNSSRRKLGLGSKRHKQ